MSCPPSAPRRPRRHLRGGRARPSRNQLSPTRVGRFGRSGRSNRGGGEEGDLHRTAESIGGGRCVRITRRPRRIGATVRTVRTVRSARSLRRPALQPRGYGVEKVRVDLHKLPSISRPHRSAQRQDRPSRSAAYRQPMNLGAVLNVQCCQPARAWGRSQKGDPPVTTPPHPFVLGRGRRASPGHDDRSTTSSPRAARVGVSRAAESPPRL
jgi:hypothetical protein